MQTFLPYPNFDRSAFVLDDTRLNKQIVECRQILTTLEGLNEKNHPAIDMWRGQRGTLITYGQYMYQEWLRRGKGEHKSGEELDHASEYFQPEMPWWLYVNEFHLSHQSRLMHKGKVDMLKTRISGPEWLRFAKTFGCPNKWYKLTPRDVESINQTLDDLGVHKATKENPYNFDVDSDLICLWPTEDHQLKYLTPDGWEIYDGGKLPRYDSSL